MTDNFSRLPIVAALPMLLPSEPTTPEGWKVAAWATIVALLGMAGLAFYWSFRAPAPGGAGSLRVIGLTCVGIAATILIAKKLIGMFLDS
jgi:hypothetical protein